VAADAACDAPVELNISRVVRWQRWTERHSFTERCGARPTLCRRGRCAFAVVVRTTNYGFDRPVTLRQRWHRPRLPGYGESAQ